MRLPQSVQFCIHALESAGYPAYAVGGCVRDSLLGLTPHDYDLCTAARPEQTAAVFADFPLVRAGEKHGTIGVVLEGAVYEITTFRTEGDYADSRHPGWVAFVSDIEQDLARRDFTVNAMAYSPTRGFADPFGGREDLKNHVLRAVGEPSLRFTEDALRILRGVRFAVKYDLAPEEQTLDAMVKLAPRLQNIAAERIFEELCKLLPLVKAENLLTFAPILKQIIPELGATMGFEQHNIHHAYDIYTHIAHVTGAVPDDLVLRWAALLHDIGKVDTFTMDDRGQGHFYGHADKSAEMANDILRRLKAPNTLREQVVQLVKLHMLQLEPEKKSIRRWMNRLSGAGIDIEHLLSLQAADMGSKGTGKPDDTQTLHEIFQLAEEIKAENACISLWDLAVNGHDLTALGYTGKAIGQALQRLLEAVLDERLPNEKEALLEAAKKQ